MPQPCKTSGKTGDREAYGTGQYSRATVDPALPWAGGAKTAAIDLGLALLTADGRNRRGERVPRLRPGHTLTCPDIAAWCGCSGEMIWRIEQTARRKLANRVHFRDLKDLREHLDGIGQTERLRTAV